MADPARRVDPVDYPESDGKPMGETSSHVAAIMDLTHQLGWHLRASRDDHFVGADNLWYFVEGDPRKVVVPDVYVVRGFPSHYRPRIWKTWAHGTVPAVVFEVTSRSTRRNDLGPKRAIYEALGVSELWLFDPLGEYLDPPVRGFVRGPSGFVDVVPAGEGRWHSPWLGLDLSLDGELLALTRGSEARPPRFAEIPEALAEAEAIRAEAEAALAEAQAAHAEANEAHAEANEAHAEAEAARSEAEAAHADVDALRARMAELEAELAHLRRS